MDLISKPRVNGIGAGSGPDAGRRGERRGQEVLRWFAVAALTPARGGGFDRDAARVVGFQRKLMGALGLWRRGGRRIGIALGAGGYGSHAGRTGVGWKPVRVEWRERKMLEDIPDVGERRRMLEA